MAQSARLILIPCLLVAVEATATAAAATDLTSPQAAAKSFASAVGEGDKAGALAACDADDDGERGLVEAMAAIGAAQKKLQVASQAHLAPAGQQVGPIMSAWLDHSAIEGAKVVEQGAAAELQFRDKKRPPLKLRKGGDGKWRLDAISLGNRKTLATQTQTLHAIAAAIEEVAAGIESAQIRSHQDASEAIESRMRRIATELLQDIPATQPTATRES